MNCTNNGTSAKPQLGMRTLTSKECTESQEALVAEWEHQRHEIDDQALLIEKLKEEIAALKLNFNNVHQKDEKKIADEQKEIDQLKKSLADRNAEIAQLKSEKIIADQNNQKLSAEKIECENQVKNLKDQIHTLEINAAKLMDKNLCEEQKKQLEQGLTAIFNEEKKGLIANANECANKVDQLKNEVSVLMNQKDADAKRFKDEMDQQKKHEENMLMNFNEEKKNLIANAVECTNKVEQLKNEVSVLLNQKEADAKRCKDEMDQQKRHEENLTMVFNEEKKNLIASAAECANKVDQLKNDISVLLSQKEADAKRCKEEMEEQKKQQEQQLTMIFNEERKVSIANANECANKVDQLKNDITVLFGQRDAESKQCREEMEKQKKQEEHNLMICNEEKRNLAASATECAQKGDQLKNEISILINQREADSKKCKEDMEEQKKQLEQQLTMTFNEERIIFAASATECANKVDQLKNEITVVVNLKEADIKRCEEQIKALTNTIANSVDKALYEGLKHQCGLEINEKKKCEEEKANQKIIINNLTIEKQQAQDALASCQSANSQAITNLQTVLENEKASVTSLAAQLQHCNQKVVECTTHVSQKELEWTKRDTDLQDEKKKCDDRMKLLEINIQQINLQHANELKLCQESVAACKTETTRLEGLVSEKHQQLQSCTDEKNKLTSELVSANAALTNLKETSTSVTVMKEKYEKLANTCLHDTSVLMRSIARRNQKFIAYWKLIENDSFMSIVGLSEPAQNELNIVMQLQLDTKPLYCNHTSY